VVAKLYAIKDRPSFNSLIAHIADLAAAAHLDTGRTPRLAGTAGPGARPLLRRRVGPGGPDTIAVRVQAGRSRSKILAAFSKPVVAPSANW
jgi:L-threonylcarbamoyladenylate synthase